MRIVLDTNVVVSALLWRGTPYRLLEEIKRHPDVLLLSSSALLEELSDVLARPSPTARLELIGKTAAELLFDYIEAVTVVEPVAVPRVVPNDEDDDQVVAAAVAARADMIVTGDRRHLLSMASYRGIHIVDPVQALERIGIPRP